MDDRQAMFARNLKALNSQFKGWVDEQYAQHAGENWSDGVESYLEHARGLLAEFKDVLDAHKDGGAAAATSPPANGQQQQGSDLGKKQDGGGASGGFSFGAASNGGSGSLFGGKFSSTAPAFGSLSGSAPAFGGAGSTAAPASGGLFGSTATPAFTMPGASASGAGFSFGGSAAAADAGGGGGDVDEQEEQQEDTAAQIEASGVDVLFKERAQLKEMVTADDGSKNWVDKGKGTITLRKPIADEGSANNSKPFIVFSALSGKVLLNAAIREKQTFTISGKAKRMVVSIFLVIDEQGKATQRTIAFTLADEATADRFIAVVKEANA